jgi:hypothetical protein
MLHFSEDLLTNYLSPWSRVLLEELLVTQLVKKFPTFYGTKDSLPCSKGPTTGPYPEPDESNPNLPIIFP